MSNFQEFAVKRIEMVVKGEFKALGRFKFPSIRVLVLGMGFALTVGWMAFLIWVTSKVANFL